MEEFTKKISTFVKNKRDSLSSGKADEVDCRNTADITSLLPAALPERRRYNGGSSIPEAVQYPSDPREDEEILCEMDREMYSEKVDPSLYYLVKLEDNCFTQEWINKERQKLLRQLTVVTKRVFNRILEQQSACAIQMEKMNLIRDKIQSSSLVVQSGRSGLAQARSQFTGSSLGILSAYRRRQQTLQLLHYLNIIQTLQRTDVRLTELLNENDFHGAIQLILECQKVAALYKHFKCVRELTHKLSDTLEMTEEALDVTLSKVCVDFNGNLYSTVYNAYKLLGKTQTSMDQLQMHVTSAIHNTAWNVIYGHAVLLNSTEDGDRLAKKTYADLCGILDPSTSVIPGLNDLCSALWRIMSSYKRIVDWHNRQDGDGDEYVGQKLNNGLTRIWQDVQTKIRIFVLSNDLSCLNFDSFLELLNMIYLLLEVGHEFCGSQSDTLQTSLKQSCWNYFSSYHESRMEEIRMHLENEGWAIVPVKPSFKISQLTEFKHLKSYGFGSPTKKSKNPRKLMTICPFDLRSSKLDETHEDILNGAPSDSDGEVELDFESDEDENRIIDNNENILTTTSLMILRLIGKYLQLMKMFDTISFDIFKSLIQLIDFYSHSVHSLFTVDLNESDLNLIDNKHNFKKYNTSSTYLTDLLRNPETLYGLKERFIAVESGIYLSKNVINLKASILKLIPSVNYESTNEMFDNCATTDDLRSPVYMTVSSRIVHHENILNLMSKISWDIKEVQSQHSNYIDIMLRELQIFSIRLGDIRQTEKIHISKCVKNVLWELCIKKCCATFVEGFSAAKKCSNEGRALMQLDFRQFIMKLEKIAEIKPIPHQDYVTHYIKAYYIPETDLEQWVQQHDDRYTEKQLIALVDSVAYNNNKTKQKLNNLISDLKGKIVKKI